jgi:hypothetical protein
MIHGFHQARCERSKQSSIEVIRSKASDASQRSNGMRSQGRARQIIHSRDRKWMVYLLFAMREKLALRRITMLIDTDMKA